MADSRATPDLSFKCENCMHHRSIGYRMVGTDETGGGPEEFYVCNKGIEPSIYNRAVDTCRHPRSQDEIDFIQLRASLGL